MWCYTTQSLIMGMVDRQQMEQDEKNINMFKDSKALLATSSSSGKTPMLSCEFCSIEAGLVQNFLLVPFKQIGSVGDVRFGMQQSWNGYWVYTYGTFLPTWQLSLQTPPTPFFCVALMWQWYSIECCNQFHTISSVWLESAVSFPSHLFGHLYRFIHV